MPEVSVYLPDELYRAAQERKLPLSALTQEAVERSARRGPQGVGGASACSAASLRHDDRHRCAPRPGPFGIRHVIVLDASALVDLVLDQRGAEWVVGQIDAEEIPPPDPIPPPRNG